MDTDKKDILVLLFIGVFVGILHLIMCIKTSDNLFNNFLVVVPLFFFILFPVIIKKYSYKKELKYGNKI